jgi:prevent-host-death family protein
VSETGQRPARVGVRELRQNLSVYLDRVKDGETLEVTEHGQAVAHLAPIPPQRVSRLEQLIAEGRVTAARGDLSDYLAAHPPVALPEGSSSVTETLIQMREEERY